MLEDPNPDLSSVSPYVDYTVMLTEAEVDAVVVTLVECGHEDCWTSCEGDALNYIVCVCVYVPTFEYLYFCCNKEPP